MRLAWNKPCQPQHNPNPVTYLFLMAGRQYRLILFDSEFLDYGFVGRYISGLVNMINYHARFRTCRLFNLANLRIIDWYHRGRTSLGMVSCNHSCFRHSLLRRFPAVCYKYDMRPVYLLRVEPDITLERNFKGKKIVLKVVFTCENIKTIGCPIMERLCLCRLLPAFFISCLFRRKNTGQRQFLAKLRQITFGFCFTKLNEYAFKIIKLDTSCLICSVNTSSAVLDLV